MDAFPSKLNVLVYKFWTYVLLPIFLIVALYLLYDTQPFSKKIESLWLPLILILQILGLHFKKKVAYWANFIFILLVMALMKLVADYLTKQGVKDIFSGSISYNEGILNGAVIGGVYGALVLALLYGWYKTKPLFYQLGIDDIDWNSTVKSKPPKDDVEAGEKVSYWILGLLLLGGVFLVSKQILESSSYKPNNTETKIVSDTGHTAKNEQLLQTQTQTQTEPSNIDLLFTAEVSKQVPELYNLISDQKFINYVYSKVVDGKTAFELIETTGKNKDISKLPLIRAVIDEYNSFKNQRDKQPDIRLVFYCTLEDARQVVVSKRSDYEYGYAILGSKGELELIFLNKIELIKNNSVLYNDELIFVMQNGKYQYHISGKSNNVSNISVYNGKKKISQHKCMPDSVLWKEENLPLLEIKERKAVKSQVKIQSEFSEKDPDRIAGLEAAKKFLVAHRGKPLDVIYEAYNKKIHSLDFIQFNYNYRYAFEKYANPYGKYAKDILK